MRRSWLTTELCTTVAGLALMIYLSVTAIPIATTAIIVTSLLISIMVNRALFKRDRAFFNDPAVKGSGEFVALLLNYALILTAIYRLHLVRELGVILLAAGQGAYTLTRGWAKRNTVRADRFH